MKSDEEFIDNTYQKICDTDKNLEKLQERQSYLDNMLDALLGLKKENLITKQLGIKKPAHF